MNEPTNKISVDQILAILGRKQVELEFMAQTIAEQDRRIQELTPDNVTQIEDAK